MFPSLIQPLVSLASGAAVATEPVLTAVASPLAAAVSGPATRAPLAPGIADTIAAVATPPGRSGPATKGAGATSGAGYATSTSAPKGAKKAAATKSSATTKSSTTKKKGPLAFLDDANLSVEEKLMRLLAYLNDKWEKDMQKKMKEMGGAQGSGSSGSSSTSGASSASTKKSGGILDSFTSIVKSATAFFPALGIGLQALQNPTVRAVASQLGGPVLAAAATAAGFPELAPAALKYGPAIVDFAAGAASSPSDKPAPAAGSGGSASASASRSSRTGGSGSTGGLSDGQERLKLMEIQRIADQQKEMFSLVSGVLRARHDARMAVIQNIR